MIGKTATKTLTDKSPRNLHKKMSSFERKKICPAIGVNVRKYLKQNNNQFDTNGHILEIRHSYVISMDAINIFE